MSKVKIELDLKDYLDEKFKGINSRLDKINGATSLNTKFRERWDSWKTLVVAGVSFAVGCTALWLGLEKLFGG